MVTHNISKTRVSVETLQAIAARHLGCAVLSHDELHEGFFNASFLLELEDGRKCVLKIAPPPEVPVLRYERNILRAEVDSLRLVHSRTGVPVPQVWLHDDSHTLLPSAFFIMDFVTGTPLHQVRKSLSAQEQAAVDRQLGGYLRQINNLAGDRFGYAARQAARFDSWRACFEAMLAGVLADGQVAEVILPLPYDELYERLASHFGVLDEVERPHLVHWDLWDGNVFVDPQTRHITGIIDFERTLWGDPLMELNFCDWALHDGLLAGYGRQPLASPTSRIRRRLYSVYLYLIMVIECTYRQYATDDQEKWARAQLAKELEQLAG